MTLGVGVGRVEEHLGDRLRGRAVPADLHRLLEEELDGGLRGSDRAMPFTEVHVLGPGEVHGLQEVGAELRHSDDADIRANSQAIEEVLSHVAVVIDGFNGDLFGYWLHPDEAPTDHPVIVKLDTEGQFSTPAGSTMVEAMVFDWLSFDDDDYLARIVAFCERHRIPLEARSHDDLRQPESTVDPVLLHDRLYRRYQPSRHGHPGQQRRRPPPAPRSSACA